MKIIDSGSPNVNIPLFQPFKSEKSMITNVCECWSVKTSYVKVPSWALGISGGHLFIILSYFIKQMINRKMICY